MDSDGATTNKKITRINRTGAGLGDHRCRVGGGLDPDLLGDFLDRLAAHNAEHDWDRHTNAAFAALGARAAEHGVALRALVDLYLSAAWRAWSQLPAVTGENPRRSQRGPDRVAAR
ncbi:MAG: hypothetical protein ACRDSH_06575 [Pseudonocardiaceae bacterium]